MADTADTHEIRACVERLRNALAAALINAELLVHMTDGPASERAERTVDGVAAASAALDDLERCVDRGARAPG